MAQKKSPKKPVSKRAAVRHHAKAHTSHLRQIISSAGFGRLYATGAALVLLGTTMFWSLLGARIQLDNADQLVNTYLIENGHVFQNASLPTAHTFLVKWPLFWLMHMYGASDAAFMGFTLLVVLMTVGLLIAVLYLLDRRPLVFGTLCLALASVLLLIPAQPYPGAILPVNMAMATTRNLEYILYIAAVMLFVRSPRLKAWGFWAAIGVLSLLVASDKLFLTLSIGGALMAVVVYAVLRRIEYVKLAGMWLAVSLAAGGIASAILFLLDYANVVHIIGQGAAGPYNLIHTPRQLILGLVFAGFGVLSNFGANIADGITNIYDAPKLMYQHLANAGGLAYLINIVVMAVGLVATWKLLFTSFLKPKRKKQETGPASRLSLILIWTGLASIVVFVLSDHYYPVDARYLAIIFFAVFIAMATYSARRKWQPEALILMGFGLLISCILGLAVNAQNYTSSLAAMSSTRARNVLVAQTLGHHPVATLIGDYWRVMPIKQIAQPKTDLRVTPYSNCLEPRGVLSSHAWETNLKTHSFAYLLSLDQHSPDFPACSLEQIVGRYGRPNSSVVIAGSIEEPQEILLFYDHGTNNATSVSSTPSYLNTVLPIPLAQLPNTHCSTTTIMNVVAHEDDDLLFLSPDLIDSIKVGDCVRSVYVTAGDAGSDGLYWLSREQGSKAAYDIMDGPDKDIWIDRAVKLDDGRFVTVSSPARHPNITLIFMRLPDGNLDGGGFKAFDHQSLSHLQNSGKRIQSVDQQSSYTAPQLTAALTALMDVYEPAEVRTQTQINMSEQYADHSDHLAVGHYATQAYAQYQNRDISQLKYYVGYPIRQWDENVFDGQLDEKRSAFFAYGRFDGSVCSTLEICSNTPTYHAYLGRQYSFNAE